MRSGLWGGEEEEEEEVEREREKEESEALLSLYSDMGSLYREESRSVRAAAQSRG